jgi:YggT family protein
MVAILTFIYLVVDLLLSAVVWLVVANAIVSWLIAFDIINLRNRAAYNVVRMLDRATSPLLRPFRRFLPTLGGLDFSPLVLIIIITAAQRALLPPLFAWLATLVGGGPTV